MFSLIVILIMSWSSISTELLQERYLFGQLAKRDLVTFSRLTAPEPGDPLNPRVSRFTVKPHLSLVAKYLHQIRTGKINRLEIEMPPRHGKSELSVRKFVPWYMGELTDRSVIIITHTDHLANEHGRDCRDIFRGAGYRLAYGSKPDAVLRCDSQAVDRLQLAGGGVALFTGRGGLGAGAGADLMIFDDFFKNSEEAESPTVRESAWHTFISDCQSRLNNDSAPIVLIGSRRHEDDVQGRLFDPTNPHYDEREAKRWTRIRLPALAEADDLLGRKPDQPLWPEKYGKAYYIGRRNHKSDVVRMDHQTQDQCHPTPAEGNYFKKKWLLTYKLEELPKYLRIYTSSDHTFRKDQKNDRSCLLNVGIDPSDTIWILPSTWWKRCETDELVEAMMDIIVKFKPGQWFAAKDAISGSIGPFWKKRMREMRAYVAVEEITEDKDLIRRAQSFRNRCAMGMVRWPGFAPFWGEMEKELITFPNGKHDDVIAACGILGMGLDKLFKAEAPCIPQTGMPKPGTLSWVKQQNERTEQEEQTAKELKGW
jgi:phage terminase large subunit-like protein